MKKWLRGAQLTLPMILLILLTSCGVPGVIAQGKSLPAAQPTATATALPPIHLPWDEAPHRDLTEWWYFTGHFSGKDAAGVTRSYGFELTFFQVLRGFVPPTYIGHFAITDINKKQFHYLQQLQIEPNASIPNGTSADGFHLKIGDWFMNGVNGKDTLGASMSGYTLQVSLASVKPPALHNGGLLTYGAAGFSYYYSYTRLILSGTIIDNGAAIPITGLAWMDHQWGNFIGVGGIGWNWFSVQLSNNTEYMIYVIRNASGSPVSLFSTAINAQGVSSTIPEAAIKEQILGTWKSPQTGITYPSGWKLQLGGIVITISPILANQELITTQTTGNIYWEGDCQVSAEIHGATIPGYGYTELTGYGA